MRFSGVSALAIWNNAVRTLSSFGTGPFVPFQPQNTSIAATSTVNFSAGAGNANTLSIGGVANAGGTLVIQLTDGTNTWTAVTIAISTTGGQDSTVSANLVFWQIHNNSATPATYFASGWIFKQ